MSSILTNTSAMVALQTLKSINMGLEKTQAEISTGKTISNAKDNAAIWAISKVMESDVTGFKAISDSLALGESTVAVAQTAAETITELLNQIKDKVVAAQGQNVDHAKLQTDIVALRDQITSVVDAAQFNGRNLVSGVGTTSVISSLNRSTTAVAVETIDITHQDLSLGAYYVRDVFDATSATNTLVSAGGDTFVTTIATGATDSVVLQDSATPLVAGDSISITIGDRTATYTFSASDLTAAGSTPADIAAVNLKAQIEGWGITGLTVDYDSATVGELVFDNATGNSINVAGQFGAADSGGLAALSGLDVTGGGTATHLGTLETLINTAITAAAAFGSSGKQIQTQMDFVSKLMDSMTSGIGSLVDANMEEASARLQALQVQQQLGIQALSIANQAPQNVLALFQ